jgi:hypothetical protein
MTLQQQTQYIMNGSPKVREQVFNILDQIAVEAVDEELIRQSVRMVKRAGVPMHKTYLEKFQNDDEFGKTDAEQRRQEASKRKEWEKQRGGTGQVGDGMASNISGSDGRSALSRRMTERNGKPEIFMPSILDPESIATIAKDKDDLQYEMENESKRIPTVSVQEAASRVSEIIARAGSGDAFDGQSLGIGGLDEVLVEIKRRIWTPLAAPPQLLEGK